MADAFTSYLNLRKPEVGHADNTWGGVSGLNGDMDLIDAIFHPGGGGTSVGLNIGAGKVLNVAGAINWVRIPPGTDQLVSLGATQTLTNKTIFAPFISGGGFCNPGLNLNAGSFAVTPPESNNSTLVATTAYVDRQVANHSGGGLGDDPGVLSYLGAGHSVFADTAMALNDIDEYFDGPELPAAGQAGEVWRIDGGAYFTSSSADTFGARLVSGSGPVGPEGVVSCLAGDKIFCSVSVIQVLSGPTAWILQARDFDSGVGQLLHGSWLVAHKVA